MTKPQPLTKTVGKAERTLQRLLATQLEQAGISFAEWTVLVFLSGPAALPRTDLVAALAHGQIADDQAAERLLSAMENKGLIVVADTAVALTDAGKTLFLPLREQVQALTSGLVEGIAIEDLEATNRTLTLVAARAEMLLAGLAA